MATENSFDPLRPLQNQKALVTGANSGIGEACAISSQRASQLHRAALSKLRGLLHVPQD